MNEAQEFDVAIVGAGIIGLAMAYEASRLGRHVVVLERSPRPQGASVRNFGMIWPIGQRMGDDYHLAMRSREIWLEVARESGIWLNPCGSLHLAYHDDEVAVIEEFAKQANAWSVNCQLLSPDEILSKSPSVRRTRLQRGLFSPTELAVNPREAIAGIAQWLQQSNRLEIKWNTTITQAGTGVLHTSNGETVRAKSILICSGHDFETLFPRDFACLGLRKCKLQMMKTKRATPVTLGCHLAGGLTLTHYKAFESCPTLPALKKRFETTMPDYVKYGIHVMASQQNTGEITIGDSHEYDDDITPFQRQDINRFILEYLNGFLDISSTQIDSTWDGTYAKHPSRLFVEDEIMPNVWMTVAPGGAGMTLSFGLAERFWSRM